MKRTNNSCSAALQPPSKPGLHAQSILVPEKRRIIGGLLKYYLYLVIPLLALNIYKLTTGVYIPGSFTSARAKEVVRDRSAYSERAQMGWNQVTRILAALPPDGNVRPVRLVECWNEKFNQFKTTHTQHLN
jgi:hypothetical protein